MAKNIGKVDNRGPLTFNSKNRHAIPFLTESLLTGIIYAYFKRRNGFNLDSGQLYQELQQIQLSS